MEKILKASLMIAGALGMLLACDPIENQNGNEGNGENNGNEGNKEPGTEVVELPVTGLEVPESAQAGKTFEIKGAGFPNDSRICMQAEKPADAKKTELESSLTPSGISCVIPAETEAGLYHLYLKSGKNEWKLTGKKPISIAAQEKPQELPVIGLSVPASVEAGQKLAIKGAGFPNDSRICMQAEKPADAKKTELESSLTPSGISCVIPAETEAGLYHLYLKSGKNEWKLTGKKALEVTVKAPEKTVSEVNVTLKVGNDDAEYRTIRFVYENADDRYPSAINDHDQMQEVPWTFTTVFNEKEITGVNTQKIYNGEFQAFHLELEGGKVKASDFTLWEDKKQPSVTWEYDAEGNCRTTDAFMKKSFDFTRTNTKNNPYGMDVAKLLYYLTYPFVPGETNLGILYASMLGLTGKSYEMLPSRIGILSQNLQGGLDMDFQNVKYTKDKDGYVTEARFGKFTMKISYR